MNANAPAFVPANAAVFAPQAPAEPPAPAAVPPTGTDGRRRNRDGPGNAGQGRSRKPRPAQDGGPRELAVDNKGKIRPDLLGFKYGSHSQQPATAPRRTPRRSNHSAPYDKERFMLANCQFLVRAGGNYEVHATHADARVDWDLVEQVRVFSFKELACPICLGEPEAPRITKCGHVYCWACILHYLALSDRKWRKCPICYESVYADALRSVRVIARTEAQVGQALSMRLMQRAKGSTAVMSRSRWTPSAIPYYSNDDAAAFCTLLLISPQDALDDIVAQDRDALEKQRREAVSSRSTEELPFIEQAQAALDAHASFLRVEAARRPADDAAITPVAVPAPALVSAPLGVAIQQQPSASESGLTLFYQAGDGQRIFLHSLNVRCLLHQYGSMEHCPDDIVGPVLELEELSVSDDTRKRFRYLGHLPLSTEFAIAELDLSQLLSPECLAHFADEIQQRARRRKQRREKEKSQQRRQARAIMQHMQQIDARDLTQFPAVSSAGPGPTEYVADALAIELAEWSPMALPPPAAPTAYSGPSFAQAAARRAAAPPVAQGPKPRPGGLQPLRPLRGPASSGSDAEDNVPATFTIDISFASSALPSTNAPGDADAGGKKDKKSKKGKQVLFATTSQRRD